MQSSLEKFMGRGRGIKNGRNLDAACIFRLHDQNKRLRSCETC